MKLYLVKTPKFVQRLFPKRTWVFHKDKNMVYLTFDDGPIPKVTPWVLDKLNYYNAKATFFCIGDNVNKHPNIFKRLISEGHSVGNHTYHHLNGWKTNTEAYIKDVLKSEALISSEFNIQNSDLLFRPPYGKLTSRQSNILQKKGYRIVMWNVLSADFDPKISKEKCLENVLKNIHPGSIVVFHDSLKSEEKLRYVLPKVLGFIAGKKWECVTI